MNTKAVVPREVRVAACADYLLGRKTSYIRIKHGVSHQSLNKWLRQTGHFQLRSAQYTRNVER